MCFSPSQLLMGRRLRSILPSTKNNIHLKRSIQVLPKRKYKNCRSDQKPIMTKKKKKKKARKLLPLKIGESVHVQKDNLWEPAKIISEHNEYSYNVQTPAGAVYCRNRKFLNTPLRANIYVHICESNVHFFLSVCSYICPSRYLLLNHGRNLIKLDFPAW